MTQYISDIVFIILVTVGIYYEKNIMVSTIQSRQ